MPSASSGSARHRADQPRNRWRYTASVFAVVAALLALTGLTGASNPAPARAAVLAAIPQPEPPASWNDYPHANVLPQVAITVRPDDNRFFRLTFRPDPTTANLQYSGYWFRLFDAQGTETHSFSLGVSAADPNVVVYDQLLRDVGYTRYYTVAGFYYLDPQQPAQTATQWTPITELKLTEGGTTPAPDPGPAPTPTPARLKIAAITDSVGSGEGTRWRWRYVLDKSKRNGRNGSWDGTWVADELHPAWEPTTDLRPAVQNCHRSTDAYPYKVAAALNADLLHLGCSGASAGNGVLSRQAFSDELVADHPQLGSGQRGYSPPNPHYDAFRPDVVLLTIGANDVQFADLVTQCYMSVFSAKYCDTDKAFMAKADKLLKVQKTDLETVITEIIQRGKATGKVPAIFLNTYYDPFPSRYTKCQDIVPFIGTWGLSPGEMASLKGLLLRLNDNIRAVGRRHPEVRLVDQESTFKGREWCSKDPAVYGPSILIPASQRSNPSPFHPTWYGQTLIGDKDIAAIRAALKLG